ncbi:hypothetical protein M8C17_07645 [Micromonospora sp. RHAY321]|uniref:hypothetical protein n=1 Tax=Micromonospora sp. RHAY321 TaxID=2944807 RepID=UPI00207D290E|nr:hypothetical protein [Micromonospora sp. RHAY321]MCO1595036.1 hypothetical protein [Micromonospora sp. RHAY321]
MNPYRRDRRADRAETERLLDASRAQSDATSTQDHASTPADPVARLLAQAAGPTRPGELAGEEAALAAFRAARADPAPTTARRPHRRRVTTGAVAWIGALAATATAGAAFAAVNLDRAPEPTPSAPSSPSSTPSDVGATPSDDRTTPPDRSTPPAPRTPSTTPSVTAAPPAEVPPAGQLRGLCHAWLAKNPEQREKALDTPAFEELVTAAGGAAEVEAYCQRLVPEATPTRSAKVKPSPTGRPAHN